MGIKYLHRNTFNRNLYRAAPPNGQLLSAECREEVAGTTYQGQRFQGHIISLGFSTVLPAALSRRTQRTQLNYPARVLSDETTLDNIVSHLMASYFAIVDSPAIKMDGHTRHSTLEEVFGRNRMLNPTTHRFTDNSNHIPIAAGQ